MTGAVVGSLGGVILGCMGGAAIASISCGIFAFLCFILALIVAALIAAAITYGGAVIGGWIGTGIASINDDKVEKEAASLKAGINSYSSW